MKLFNSFGHAWRGTKYAFRTQLNFRIHLGLLLIVVALGFFFNISTTEWLIITCCSMIVLALELMNTAIEHLCDTVTKEIHASIKIVKDAAAAAVLVAAAGSTIAGIIIFFPKIMALITRIFLL